MFKLKEVCFTTYFGNQTSGAKTVRTPLEFKHKLTSVEFDQHIGGSDDSELEDVNI